MIRIVDKLNFTKFIQSPKWVVGFSDITVLHSAIQKYGIASIHGPMTKSFLNYTNTGVDVDVLFSFLTCLFTVSLKMDSIFFFPF